jgi:SAM-dependent methyltransferase
VRPVSDPALVRAEYADEKRFLARQSRRWAIFFGDSPEQHALLALLEVRPRRILDAGCGPGQFAESVEGKLGCEVVGIDLSERMVELTRARGAHALVADVEELPFADGEFDAVAANWMLYHLPRLDRGLAELQRVVRSGGRLVATTNGRRHLAEVWGPRASSFDDENGAEALARHFDRVERRDVAGKVVFATREALSAYLDGFSGLGRRPVRPVESFTLPLEGTLQQCVFVADGAT